MSEPQISEAPASPPREFALFTPGQIVVSSILASPLAGVLLVAENERRLGRGSRGLLYLLGSLLFVALVILVTVKAQLSAIGFGVHALTFGFWFLAQAQDQQAPPNTMPKNGSALLVVLASILGIVAALGLFVAFGDASFGNKVTIGTHKVFYRDGATKEDAQRIGDALVKDGYFIADRETDVQLLREGDHDVLVLITSYTSPTPAQRRAFQEMAEELGDTLAPRRLELALADNQLEIKTRIEKRERLVVGNTTIYRVGGTTQEEAQHLVDALVAARLIATTQTHHYELARSSDGGFTVSVPLKLGMWDDREVVKELTEAAKAVSAAFDNRPVHYLLCDSDFDPKRTVP